MDKPKPNELLHATAELLGAAARFRSSAEEFANAVRYENFHRLEGLLPGVRESQEALGLALIEFDRVLGEKGIGPPPPCNRFDTPDLPPICCRTACPRVGVEKSGDGVRWYCERHWKEAINEGNPSRGY